MSAANKVCSVAFKDGLQGVVVAVKTPGLWRWNEKLGHYFLNYHPWSLCVKEHRMYAKKEKGLRKCAACRVAVAVELRNS